MLRIGIVGCGAIGQEIARAIDDGLVAVELCAVCDVDRTRAEALAQSLRAGPRVLEQVELIREADLVIEATSQAVAPGIIREVLAASRDVLVMSVGGLLKHYDELRGLAERVGRRIYVPSGAIAGLDAVKAAMVGSVSTVVLTTRKPPKGLAGAPYVVENKIDLEGLREATVIFSGPAEKAVPAFPANINVAAALSLAGIGAARTLVRIIADPGCERNTHEIEAEGDFGRLLLRAENVPSPSNPKTSRLAALSAVALLRRLTATVVVGS
jgi:aspartate dehydrogenase